jgi:hypothetical protein
LIAERAQDTPAQLQVWLALLDMYRAAGMQAQFEDAAMDFVARFGRSAAMVCDAAAGGQA